MAISSFPVKESPLIRLEEPSIAPLLMPNMKNTLSKLLLAAVFGCLVLNTSIAGQKSDEAKQAERKSKVPLPAAACAAWPPCRAAIAAMLDAGGGGGG